MMTDSKALNPNPKPKRRTLGAHSGLGISDFLGYLGIWVFGHFPRVFGYLPCVLACLALSPRASLAQEVRLSARGDAGAAVSDDAPLTTPRLAPSKAAAPAVAGETRCVRTSIHTLGGGVRGFAVLARYPAPGPRTIHVRRATAFPEREPYTPIALVRIMDPHGATVAIRETTDQEPAEAGYTLTVPPGPAGVWRIAVTGGRQGDRYEVTFPDSAAWGIRGEMALSLDAGIPNPAYVYVPASARKMAVERIGGRTEDLNVFDAAGQSLGSPVVHPGSGKRAVLELDEPHGDAVLKLVFSQQARLAVVIDGVPGLLCPSAAVARDLKGGSIDAGGLTTAGAIQARARAWMLARTAAELDVKPAEVPDWSPETIAHPAAEAQWIRKGECWTISSDFAGGTLTWQYAFIDNGLRIEASLQGSDLERAFVNLPILADKELELTETPDRLTASRAGTSPLTFQLPPGATLSPPVPCHPNPNSVRRLQLPLTTEGSGTVIQIVWNLGRKGENNNEEKCHPDPD
jgi:hypothetical protein